MREREVEREVERGIEREQINRVRAREYSDREREGDRDE